MSFKSPFFINGEGFFNLCETNRIKKM